MTAIDTLKAYFGYDNFRPGQESLINDILAGKDVLGIMPTGAGKSICFQVPALMTDGIALVISPLISLMKDQVNALNQTGAAAAFINSSLSDAQIAKALRNAGNDAYKLIYVAPERLGTYDFINFAASADISMVVVDEAHCISQWGQDFRPSYTAIPNFVSALRKRPILSAFTATATPKVREDIIERLALKSPTVLVAGFDRPNLYLDVLKPPDKTAALASFLADRKTASGIVYCSTRNTVEDVHLELLKRGYKASRYHAGLTDKERHDNQDDFIHDRINIMVATNAFGMGIDKSDLSFVVHFNMPKDVEAYYQEAGRAGRDGEPAHCLLLHGGRDYATNLWLIDNGENKAQLDSATEALLRERNLKRLNEMALYCETRECLRAYILRYFGEEPPANCGNCANCNTTFEEVDITTEAQKIISCVARMRERFGVKMIIDVLKGNANQRVRSFRLDGLSTFGISQAAADRLADMINQMILDGYLHKTAEKFPVIKLGPRAAEALRPGNKVIMKTSARTQEAKRAPMMPLRPVDGRLYEALKALRLSIANKNALPAFTIFHDSTLTDMCMKMPASMDEMLEVSGVGQVKAQRYGQAFLDIIKNHRADAGADNAPPPFHPKQYNADEVEITEEAATVSTIADRINVQLLQCGLAKITGKRINDWLVSQNYLTLAVIYGKNFKVPTKKGEHLGIEMQEREIRGENAVLNFYASRAQIFIAENAGNI
ncbi:MAG: DNA helicase RecQ [Clostridiales bacterium]|nr:DNA helicase RecQ [Clostridiales bacterium]